MVARILGPAPAADWYKPANSGFSPAAEVVKDGDDAVVRVELPGVDVEKDGRTLTELRYGSFRRSFQLTVRVAGALKDPAGSQAQRIEITK